MEVEVIEEGGLFIGGSRFLLIIEEKFTRVGLRARKRKSRNPRLIGQTKRTTGK